MMAASGQVIDETVYQVAKTVGLDLDRLKRDMASPEIDAALKANHTLAEALDITGTPGFVIGDQIVPGAIELSSLKELVAEARRK
jgi:2-hydroxychromene-2-carboxylate isomerase